MKEAIKLAIEGGFKHQPSKSYNYYLTMCNPLFWQSLGKALKWDKKCSMCGEYEGGHNYRHPFSIGDSKWKEVWHSFIDHLAEGKDADDFFSNLTNKG